MVTELQKIYGKPPGVELQELVNMFHSCKQADEQSVSDHVLLMKSYLDQLATLNYAFPDKVSISFILNSLSSEFQAFMQNYNTESMEKTISKVDSLLIEFEKSIKRNKHLIVGASSTPQVMAIQGGRVQKYKPQGKAKGKGKGKGPQNSYPTKPKKPQPYKKELSKKDAQCHHCKEEGHWKRNCHVYLAELMKKKKKKKTGGQNVAFTSLGYPKETMGYYFYYPPENKIVVERYADFLEKDGRIVELEDEDILPSENTSEHPIEEENLAPIVSQEEDVIPVRRSVRTHKAPDRLCLNVEIDPDRLCFNVEVEEHSLGALNEPANYKAALLDPEFEKWLVAMNAEMQSMYDNKVWRLVVFPPNAKVVKKMKRMQNVPYASVVGSIIYVVRNTKDTFFVYGGDHEAELRVNCYCDAGFETDRDDTKSQTRYVFVLNGCTVVWESCKQSTTAQHATEAEYIASSEAVKEVVWIRKFIDELGVVPSNDYPIKMSYDNFASIIMTKESGIQKGARHFKRKYHYVRECIETGKIDIVKVHTDDNLVDPFTKALAGPKLTRHARSMGLLPASSFM
nr:hypothetical protein [Tanacetum cinerariifolium]